MDLTALGVLNSSVEVGWEYFTALGVLNSSVVGWEGNTISSGMVGFGDLGGVDFGLYTVDSCGVEGFGD